MVRTKNVAGRGKRKATDIASSSRNEEPSDIGEKPIWGSGPLYGMPREWQLELFCDKMNELTSKSLGFICERVINRRDFEQFGITKYFQDLGWEAVMGFDEMQVNKLYMEPIQEWMGTLEMVAGNNYPKSMSLVGTVGGVEITMSLSTLNHIARFDTKASNLYIYPDFDVIYNKPTEHPTWNRMVERIFEPGRGSIMSRNDLKQEAKLLLMFLNTNVMPRRGDKTSVRHSEVPILYALMDGVPKISFRHLAMMNIWEARNNKEKKVIPHCKLIQALFRWNGLFDGEVAWEYTTKREVTYEITKLRRLQWDYQQSDRYHRLIDMATNRVWDTLKADARPLQRGEPDVFNSEGAIVDMLMGGTNEETDEDEQPLASIRGRRRGESSSHQPPPQYQFQNRGTPWGMVDDEMQRVTSDARPTGWRDWPPFARTLFDQGTQHSELQRRETQRVYEEMQQVRQRNELWHTTHAYNVQREINQNFDDAQQRRMHEEWHRGEQVVQHPPVIDYTSLDPYDGTVRYPQPQVHHSEWLNPYQNQQQQQNSGEEIPGAYDFSAMNDLMTSIFGPPQPRYF